MHSRRLRVAALLAFLGVGLLIQGRLVAVALGEAPRLRARLPTASQSCPQIREGTLSFLDAKVRILARGRRGTGPLILYWHGTDSSPERELSAGIGEATLDEVRRNGGVVVGMVSGFGRGENTSGNAVWFSSDMQVADEVVACALQQRLVDPAHIHVVGMSAGGLQTASFAYRRAHYVASVVTFSGGHVVFNERVWTDTRSSQPDNRFAALAFHGGEADVVGMSFVAGSRAFQTTLKQRGHFAVVCDHGLGHKIPPDGGALALRFFKAHPFGQSTSPFAAGLPSSFAYHCEW